jgi:hypothetical protein
MTKYFCYPIADGVGPVVVEANAGDPHRAAELAAIKTQMPGRWVVAQGGPVEFEVTERRTYTAKDAEQ